MAKPSDKDRIGAWQKRIDAASKTHREWAEEFDCDLLEDFYYGHQAMDENEQWDKRQYVINLFYPAIQISQPSMLFSVPKYKVDPRMTRLDDAYSDVAARAKLQEQTLNYYVTSPELGFGVETDLAVLDAQFRFGVIQVGYTADFIDNPTAGAPVLNDKNEPMIDSAGKEVVQPVKNLTREDLYLKWIPAAQWRVSDNAPNRLEAADWCGYYEWHRIEDVMSNKRYKNTSGLKAHGKLRNQAPDPAQTDEEKERAGMIRLWFIWDRRAKMRRIFVQGAEKFLLEEPYTFLPFPSPLKFHERLGKFYPLPPSYNWVHPQRELNDTREMQRIHRRRAKRRYRRSPGVSEEEFAKLVDGEDMVCIETPNENDITPIPDAPLDPAVVRNIIQTQDDFTRVSGVSGEQQEVAQSETATQANLIALASRVRDAKRRFQVAEFLSDLGRVILLTLRERMALPFWIKMHVDADSPLAALEAQDVAKLWKRITNTDLGAIDNDITVEITSLSPVAQEQERNEWLSFLGLILSPGLGAILSQSPSLLRKTAGLFNIHSERDLMEIGNAMRQAAQLQAQAAMAQASKGTSGLAAPGPTPSNGAIAGQLRQQLPVEVGQIE